MFAIPVQQLTLVKGSDHMGELEEIRYRMKELDPDTMTYEDYDAAMAKLRAERNPLKALPAEPDRRETTSPTSCTPTYTPPSPSMNAAPG